jgi:hypothetical protein
VCLPGQDLLGSLLSFRQHSMLRIRHHSATSDGFSPLEQQASGKAAGLGSSAEAVGDVESAGAGPGGEEGGELGEEDADALSDAKKLAAEVGENYEEKEKEQVGLGAAEDLHVASGQHLQRSATGAPARAPDGPGSRALRSMFSLKG